jgi:hypothetical protein
MIARTYKRLGKTLKRIPKPQLGLYELKQHKPWFDEECSRFLHKRKQAKMQWVQNAHNSNVVNLNYVRREASRHFRNKKNKYLKAKTDEIETNSKIKNTIDLYRDVIDFKKCYQPGTNIAKVEKGGLFTDSHSILVI